MFLLTWIKQHKVVTLLLLIILYFVFNSFVTPRLRMIQDTSYISSGSDVGAYPISDTSTISAPPMGFSQPKMGLEYPISEAAPQVDVANRLVIESSNVSLLVSDVVSVKDQIIEYAQTNGGYMVSSHTSNPQDAPNAQVTIRIPSSQLKPTLAFLHGLSIKVVSENLDGMDVTDQYVDIDAQIANLEKTKVRFESILNTATEVSDIANLSQQIIQIQNQIDSYKGQQLALEKNAQLAKITIYLSTDEIALPYAPSETWRPEVIVKLAVRSMISHLRSVGTIVIWIGVYSLIWIPLGLVAWFLYKKFGKRTP